MTPTAAVEKFFEHNPRTGGVDGTARRRSGEPWTEKTREQFRLPALLLEQAMHGRPLATVMAPFICEIHHKLSIVGLVQGAEFLFPLKQHELADVLGLAPVHVNRKVQQLRQEGLIAQKGQHLEILDLARLQLLAGSQSAYLGDLKTIDISHAAGQLPG